MQMLFKGIISYLTAFASNTSISNSKILLGGIFGALVLIEYAKPEGITIFNLPPVFTNGTAICQALINLFSGKVAGLSVAWSMISVVPKMRNRYLTVTVSFTFTDLPLPASMIL